MLTEVTGLAGGVGCGRVQRGGPRPLWGDPNHAVTCARCCRQQPEPSGPLPGLRRGDSRRGSGCWWVHPAQLGEGSWSGAGSVPSTTASRPGSTSHGSVHPAAGAPRCPGMPGTAKCQAELLKPNLFAFVTCFVSFHVTNSNTWSTFCAAINGSEFFQRII